MATVYKSKIDWWLLIILASAMAASLYASAEIVLASSPSAWWLLAVTAGIGIGLPLWLLLATNYILETRQLLVRSGPFKWKVPIADITSITATSNPLSGPALSLDRLRIEYGRGSAIMISPRNKDQFLREIEALRRGPG
jgi:Bacterial PH domain